MKKAEMESHQAHYDSCMSNVRAAIGERQFRRAIAHAREAWNYIDGMMQYERKYENADFESVEAIDLVLRYAPLLFDACSLEALESLLKETPRIERNTAADLATRLTSARSRMWDARQLWIHIKQNPDARQDEFGGALGGRQDNWREITEAWERMGLVDRAPEGRSYRVWLATDLDAKAVAKCTSCGRRLTGPKRSFLEEHTCPACKKRTSFVLLKSRVAAKSEG